MFKNLTDSEKKTLMIWFIIAGIILVGLIVIGIIERIDSENELYNKDYKKLSDSTRYYTVNGAINKYYSFINAKDKESILSILSDSYKESNKIDSNNVLEKVGAADNSLSVRPSYMCYREYKKGISEYIFKATISSMNKKNSEENYKYYRVYLDEKSITFSVEEITEEYFGGNCK